MASQSYKNPPALADDKQYEMWVKEVVLWSACCKLEKKEQGPALALSLSGNARQAALNVDVAILKSDEGLDAIINKLNGLFLKDENQRLYVALKDFEQYKRPENISIDNYLNEFDLKYGKLKAHRIELPDAVLAYRLLESANLDKTKSELVRATVSKLSFDEMKKQLRKLEDIAMEMKKDENDILYNAEEYEPEHDTLYNSYNFRGNRSRGGRQIRGSGSSYRRGNFNNGENQSRGRGYRGRGRGGLNFRGACFICASTEHQIRDCPKREVNENNPDVKEENTYIVDIDI